MTMRDETSSELWKVYEADLDLYKFYLDLAVKAAGFFFTLTGGMLAYSLAHYRESKIILLALLFPTLMGGVLAALYYKGARGADVFRKDHETTSAKLGVKQPFDLTFLRDALRVLTWMHAVMAVVVFAAFLWLMAVVPVPEAAKAREVPNPSLHPTADATGEGRER
jgi:hypothetical protein